MVCEWDVRDGCSGGTERFFAAGVGFADGVVEDFKGNKDFAETSWSRWEKGAKETITSSSVFEASKAFQDSL
jgi:hypothetical protein